MLGCCVFLLLFVIVSCSRSVCWLSRRTHTHTHTHKRRSTKKDNHQPKPKTQGRRHSSLMAGATLVIECVRACVCVCVCRLSGRVSSPLLCPRHATRVALVSRLYLLAVKCAVGGGGDGWWCDAQAAVAGTSERQTSKLNHHLFSTHEYCVYHFKRL